MNHPVVSVCVPTYNGEEYLREALLSIECQTFTDLEVIISDDHSSDKTVEIAEWYAKTSKFDVQIFTHTPNSIGANWNNTIIHSKGDYIKLLFQDDLLEPDCLEKMVSEFAIHGEEVKMVYSSKLLIGDVPEVKQEEADKLFRTYKDFSSTDFLRDTRLFTKPRNKIGEPTCVMLKKEVFDSVGLFDERLAQSLDYEYWLRILSNFEVKSIDAPLVKFRIHAKQTTQANSKKVVRDRFLLPGILLKNGNRYRFKVKILLVYKFLTGLLEYTLFQLVRKSKERN